MDQTTYGQVVSFILDVADDALRWLDGDLIDDEETA